MTDQTFTGEMVPTNDSGVQAIIDAGLVSADPAMLVKDELAAFMIPHGAKVQLVDIAAQLAEHQDHPERKTGTFKVHDADSFVTYMGKHSLPESEVWADTIGNRIVGVINAHESVHVPVSDDGALAGWGDHRVTYDVKTTKAWDAWIQHDGDLLGQAEFAEHIEDRLVDIVRPASADILELAQTFEANIGAGKSGQLEIPRDFDLGLIPFEGAVPFKVVARLRYRIQNGVLRIGYRLVRPEDVLRDAFESVIDTVREGVDCPVFRGVSG
jgi:uncharacterized protein YfdQ (DUF2303 family)